MTPSPPPLLVCIVAVVMMLASYAVRPSEGCCQPPSGVWCQYQELPETVPFNATKEIWWNEYFLFNATMTGQIGFKLYAGMASTEYFTVIVAENYCPNFADGYKNTFPLIYSYGTASTLVNVTEGQSYVIFAHMAGNNYSIVGCEGPCGQICPNDCTTLSQGVCDVTKAECVCNTGWTGADCSKVDNTNGTSTTTGGGTTGGGVHHHHKVPFGSEAVFIFVVAGLPTAVVITFVTVTIIYLVYRKKEQERIMAEKRPLLYPPSSTANGNANGHYPHYPNGNHRNSVSLSPAFPPPPRPSSPQYERAPSPVTTQASSSPISESPGHRSPDEQQSLHRRNNNKM